MLEVVSDTGGDPPRGRRGHNNTHLGGSDSAGCRIRHEHPYLTPTYRTIRAEKIPRGVAVKVKFSRHAKRRAKLYGIPESTVEQVISEANLTDGTHEIIRDIPGFKYPLKIVATRDGEIATVITAYPLKKRATP